MFFWNDPTDGVSVNNFGQLSEPLTYNTPAAAMCSLVRIGWKPTKGTCIDMRRPMMKKVVYAKNNTVKLINKNNFIRYIITKQWDSISTWMHHTILLNTKTGQSQNKNASELRPPWPFNSQIKFVILFTVNYAILIMLIQRI